jgi:ABC-type glycerol-3-phosphate transport system permease component
LKPPRTEKSRRDLIHFDTVNGASRWRTFYSIILPIVKPALTAVAIVSFQNAWNDFLWPLVVLGTRDMYTLPLGPILLQKCSLHKKRQKAPVILCGR